MNFNVAYAGLCACILWYNIASVNSVGDAQMDVAAGNRSKTDRCLTPAQIIDPKIRQGNRHWKIYGRSQLIEEFTWYD